MTQKWEYKIVVRARGVNRTGDYEVDAWKYWDDGTPLRSDTDLAGLLAWLGGEGWELVSVMPRSSFATRQAPAAGLTTEEVFYFKRPR